MAPAKTPSWQLLSRANAQSVMESSCARKLASPAEAASPMAPRASPRAWTRAVARAQTMLAMVTGFASSSSARPETKASVILRSKPRQGRTWLVANAQAIMERLRVEKSCAEIATWSCAAWKREACATCSFAKPQRTFESSKGLKDGSQRTARPPRAPSASGSRALSLAHDQVIVDTQRGCGSSPSEARNCDRSALVRRPSIASRGSSAAPGDGLPSACRRAMQCHAVLTFTRLSSAQQDETSSRTACWLSCPAAQILRFS
mmetsp:Transcript_95361/g.294127  ORF Transcript_95361/g.294127 Transcript_95361/m.294127 type:complete len:261 (+) Transcript_95361:1721-2503(+)